MNVNSDLATLLVVGAIGFIILNQRDSVFIGAVAKDPCAGLTGATLAACRKVHPQGITPAAPKGITAAKPKPKGITPAVYKGPSIEPKTPPGSIIRGSTGAAKPVAKPTGPVEISDKEFEDTCRAMASYMLNYKREHGGLPPQAELQKRWSTLVKQGKFAAIYRCANGVINKFSSQELNVKYDDKPTEYSNVLSQEPGQEQSRSIPVNPIGQFVNGIASFLQQAWNNLTQGKTAIGGQPVFPGGRGVVRPVITPIA